jgi:hypothetical protein
MTTPLYAFDQPRQPKSAIGTNQEQKFSLVVSRVAATLRDGGTMGIVAAEAEGGLETVAFGS